MIRVKFIAQSLDKKTRVQTNSVYYQEIDEIICMILEGQRVRLENEMPFYRIMLLIENME